MPVALQQIAPARCLLVVEALMQQRDEFTTFVRAHTSALLRTAYLLTADAVAAEELVQDTLVHLYPKWDKVAAADVPLAYVRRSLANGFVNQRRRPASREYAVEAVPDRGVPDAAVAQLADRDEIWTLLRQLPERQRAALVLRYFHDLPDDEIAGALHCRLGTVRSLISRGLSAMRENADRAPGAWPVPRSNP
jgi:RNA polymerase sigma-70 factor (sigma-E family)